MSVSSVGRLRQVAGSNCLHLRYLLQLRSGTGRPTSCIPTPVELVTAVFGLPSPEFPCESLPTSFRNLARCPLQGDPASPPLTTCTYTLLIGVAVQTDALASVRYARPLTRTCPDPGQRLNSANTFTKQQPVLENII